MKPFFLELWTDPDKFRTTVRTLLVALAGGIATGAIPLPPLPLPPAWAAWVQTLIPVALGSSAVAIRVGQSNPKEK